MFIRGGLQQDMIPAMQQMVPPFISKEQCECPTGLIPCQELKPELDSLVDPLVRSERMGSDMYNTAVNIIGLHLQEICIHCST